jgi:hypothetical protein
MKLLERAAVPRQDRARSGAALVMVAVFLLALVPAMGLAVDGANVYIMNSQITTALKASVLAGTRNLGLGPDTATQQANALTAAINTWNINVANMNPSIQWSGPNYCFGSGASCSSCTDHYQCLSGTVNATLPTMILPIISINSAPGYATATAKRRDVNLMLVLDNSGPMGLPDYFGFGTPYVTMAADVQQFINLFANGRDNIGLITFNGGPYVAEALPNKYFQSNIPNDLANLAAPGDGISNQTAALDAAYQQLKSLNEPAALNVIVLFTDGVPTGITGNFSGYFRSTQTYCNAALNPLYGLIETDPTQSYVLAVTDYISQGINDTPEDRPASTSSPGACTRTGVPIRMLASMPTQDLFGNSTTSPYQPVVLSVMNEIDITNAAENTLYNEAYAIRSDTTFSPIIFAIGLGGNENVPPDATLLSLVANDPSYTGYGSLNYISTQPEGQYIFAPTEGNLLAAFQTIASSVLQLTK